MKKLTLLFVSTATALAIASTAHAQLITDNFNRGPIPATGFTTTVSSAPFSAGGAAGTWVNGTAGQEWRISTGGQLIKNILTADGAVAHSVLYNSGVTMNSGGTVTADMSFDSAVPATVRGGIAFNFVDANNFYFLRIQNGTAAWDLTERVGGSFNQLASGTASANFGGSNTYSFSVTNTNAGSNNITFSITGTNITAIGGTLTDTSFTTGFGGVYAGNNNATPANQEAYRWDNFSAIPEPTSAALLLGTIGVLALFRRRNLR